MPRPIPRVFGLVAAAMMVVPGCGGTTPGALHPVSINATPDKVLNPDAPKDAKPAAAQADAAAPAPSPDVRLVAIAFDDLKGRIVADKASRLTMVDVWSSTCAPCKENFPHVVAMHAKYGGKGLAVVSLSMDPPDDPKAVAAAEAFLREQKATFTNLRMSEAPEVVHDKLDFSVLPAVFLFTPDGEVLKKFTWDDPNHQFTYEEVEKAVEARLGDKG